MSATHPTPWKSLGSLFLGACSLGACASALPPPELADARARVAEATSLHATFVDPHDVEVAKSSLDRAERTYTQEGDTAATRGLAYVANRQAELALARASTAKAENDSDKDERTLASERDLAKDADERLLDQQGRFLLAMDRDIQEELRQEPARRLVRALGALSGFANVDATSPHVVVSVPTMSLFLIGHVDLRRSAAPHLDDVVHALAEDPASHVDLTLHDLTANTGPRALSVAAMRVNAVERYLVGHGVASARIRTASHTADADASTGDHVDVVIDLGAPPSSAWR